MPDVLRLLAFDAGDLVPIVAIVCIFGLPLCIPIIVMLTKHQQRMAELLSQNRQADPALMQQMEQMRQTLVQQQATIDGLRSQIAAQSAAPPPTLERSISE